MSRLVVTGADGLLGSRITNPTSPFHDGSRTVVGFGKKELDITDAVALRTTIAQDDVVINCAAYTAVDAAETDIDRAFAVNTVGVGLLARTCAEKQVRLVHISTGYVFDGSADNPYETFSPAAPINVYGRSKLAGEQAARTEFPDALIVRTMWLYSEKTSGFPAALLSKCERGEPVSVVSDQFASPTYTDDLVFALSDLVAHPEPPLLTHATSTGAVSKYEFACAIAEVAGFDVDLLRPCRTTDVRAAADRPRNAVLSDSSWTGRGLKPLPDWRDALRRAFAPAVTGSRARCGPG
ncbi:dTDP-4-dehydrorhamnose reductase [Streptomyces sp. NPDC088847]|uniref:dTDP-4-dehydrorhamnose reductase n=1 Tax=Streptomyces sp. NPDC088847 TaxID=3365909 RepID=UPI0037FA6B81